MRYDGVLFDLDGTLWNATQAIASAWAVALKKVPEDLTPPTAKELEGVMGMTSEQLMATLFPSLSEARGQELFDLCCQVENAYLREHGGKLYEGTEEMLRKLSARVPLFVVSNCNNGYIESFLDGHGFRGYFQDWECIGRTGLQKWENIRLVAERNGLTSPVYVGDTAMDQEAARLAGVPFLHAAYGFGSVTGAEEVLSPLSLIPFVCPEEATL